MQPVIWFAKFQDGTEIREFDETGKETVFPEILPRKNELTHLALIDLPRKKIYGIDLITGQFNLDGIPFHVGKEVDGRTFRLTGLNTDYADGVIQYKCSMPVDMAKNLPVQAATYNIGYKIELPKGTMCFPRYSKGVVASELEVVHAQPMISVDAHTYEPTVTISLTVRHTVMSTGVETLIRV